ncbi:GIY-YIG nuclease family protein [Actinomyces minihominis]|uniref:GIY-YIG nuclease family protein n=1 Tax=Actinomyces minihominis TaxID=2002838 RepID=UPI000C071435|nr:GIY-YIG nuclease family protein [Actinomyces minihominis]
MKKWILKDPSSVQALFPTERRGIYVLHFENGEQYVGQTENIVARYAQHRHGSGHHAPWEDVVAIEFLHVPKGKLDPIEREWIRNRRQQVILRNKAFNFGHAQPSVLDPFVPIEAQEHWATGQASYDVAPFVEALKGGWGRERPRLAVAAFGRQKLPDGRMVWEAVVDELAQVVADVIPNAIETEGKFWSLSDSPSTSGGRFATLNVGVLELAFFPRVKSEAQVGSLDESNGLTWILNAEEETFIPYEEVTPRFKDDEAIGYMAEIAGMPVGFFRIPEYYSVPVDRVEMPLGAFGVQVLSPSERDGVRRLAIHMMRSGSLGANQRSHSRALTRLVYERIVERAMSSS